MEKNKLQHVTTDKLVSDIRSIIEQGRQQAYAAANQIAVLTYWHIGRRIVEEEQHGEARAQYGTRLIKTLAEQLMPKYGSTFSKRNLDYFRQFYLCFNDLEIVNTRVHNLTRTHLYDEEHPHAYRAASLLPVFNCTESGTIKYGRILFTCLFLNRVI